MSIKIMSMVFDRYPASGGERLTALKLADHSRDDGTDVRPGYAYLAQQTRQTPRAVMNQVARAVARGWLLRVTAGGYGQGQRNVFRISPDWLAGGELRPIGTAATECGKGEDCSPLADGGRVNEETPLGEPEDASIEPTEPRETQRAEAASPQTRAETKRKPGARRSELLKLQAWIDGCKERGEKPIPPDDPVIAYANAVGISDDILGLHWWMFKRKHAESGRAQRDWRRTFRNSVEGNWYRLWFIGDSRVAELTTAGRQAHAFREAETRRAEALDQPG